MRRKSVHLFVPVGSRAQKTHLWKSHADTTNSWNNTAANGIPSVPRRALVTESLSLNNLLGLEVFQGLPQLRDGERVGRAEVDNQPHGASSSGPVSRGRPGGRVHAYLHIHTHTRVACILNHRRLTSLSQRWSPSGPFVSAFPRREIFDQKTWAFKINQSSAGFTGPLLDRAHSHF